MTGAAGGIGTAVVRRLTAEGAAVFATDIAADALRVLIEQLPGTAGLAADLARPGGCAAVVAAAIRGLGGLHGLVHCVAIGKQIPILDCPLELWNQILAVNLTTTFEICQLVGRRLAEQGDGVLIALGSGAGIRPNAGNAPYGASKAGLIGLMRAAAMDLAPRGVRANVIIPGPTDTPLMRGMAGKSVPALRARTMLNRLGRPEEIAAAIVFLLSDEARYVTGAVLGVDGGFSNAGVRLTDPG